MDTDLQRGCQVVRVSARGKPLGVAFRWSPQRFYYLCLSVVVYTDYKTIPQTRKQASKINAFVHFLLSVPSATFHLVLPVSLPRRLTCPAGRHRTVKPVLVCWGLCGRPQTPPPEAWPLDSITRFALALALTRSFQHGGKDSVPVPPTCFRR